MLIDECGEPLPESFGQQPVRDWPLGSAASSSSSPAFPRARSPSLRLGRPAGGPEVYCIHTPAGESTTEPAPSSSGSSARLNFAGQRSGFSARHPGSPVPASASERAISSPPSFCGSSPPACKTPIRSLATSSPELVSTRRALWQELKDVAGPNMTCPMIDWSMPSTSSWVGMSSGRPVSVGSPFLASPLPRRRDCTLTPPSKRGSELIPTWPLTPQLHGMRASPSASSSKSSHGSKARRALGQQKPFPPAPPTSSEVRGHGDEASSQKGLLAAAQVGHSRTMPTPQTHPLPKPAMDAFRSALQAAEGLDNGLRQDLLSLVDDLARPRTPTDDMSGGFVGIPIVDHWEATMRSCRSPSASPSQSDVEAALATMNTPPRRPLVSPSVELEESPSLNGISMDRDFFVGGACLLGESPDDSSVRRRSRSPWTSPPESCPSRNMSSPLSPPTGHASPEALLSPEATPRLVPSEFVDFPMTCTPESTQLRRSAMWPGVAPTVPGVEALTPAALEARSHGDAPRRISALAAARDRYKKSVGACERSHNFQRALVEELGTLRE